MNHAENSSALSELSDALAAAVERASAYTVSVNARRRLPASGIIWSAGVVVTADHVIERDEEISVTLPDGTTAPATIAGRDPGSDLAVLRVAAATTPAPQAADAKVGHLVLAVGRPGGNGLTASMGVISTLGGPWRSGRGSTVDGYIRADVTMYPGFSGGPLVDACGAALGINSSGISRAGGLTIPVAAAAKIIDALLTHGRLKRGFLGITSQVVRLSAAIAGSVGQESGLLVARVEPGSPAEQGGLLIGDVLIGIAGASINDTDDLQAYLGPDHVGQATPVRIVRGGEPRELSIAIGQRE